MWFIILILAAIAIGLVVLNYLEKNSIAINTRDGPLSSHKGYKVLSIAVENLIKMMEMNFFQPQIKYVKYVGKMIISKNLMKYILQRFDSLRNNLNEVAYRLNFLGNDKSRDGPFLGNKFRGMYSMRC